MNIDHTCAGENVKEMKHKNIAKSKYLVVAYMLILASLFTIAVATPLFIRGNVTLTKKIVLEEDMFETLLIAALLGLAYTVHRAYRKELENLKTRHAGLKRSHTEAFKYIGAVNAQLRNLWEVLPGYQRYPETKAELQRILSSTTRNLRGIVSAEWILIRIIDQNNFRTITEQWESFSETTSRHIQISNRAIAEDKTIDGFSIVSSRRNNLAINVACIIPVIALVREEKILIEAIVRELEMLFIIFTLQYP